MPLNSIRVVGKRRGHRRLRTTWDSPSEGPENSEHDKRSGPVPGAVFLLSELEKGIFVPLVVLGTIRKVGELQTRHSSLTCERPRAQLEDNNVVAGTHFQHLPARVEYGHIFT